MSRSPADDRQQQFQNLHQQHQQQVLTSPVQNKTIHQQQQFVSTVNLIPGAATVGTGITVGYQQQHLVATNSGGSNILVSGVNNDSASTILVPAGPGVRTQQNNSIAGSASGILVPNVNVVASPSATSASVFGGQSAGANIYIQTGPPSSGTSSAVISVVPSGAVGPVPVSPTTPRKRIKLEQQQQQSAGPVVEVEHDLATLKKLILEHKYMRLRNIKEK